MGGGGGAAGGTEKGRSDKSEKGEVLRRVVVSGVSQESSGRVCFLWQMPKGGHGR